MQPEAKPAYAPDLRSYVAILRRRKWTIALVVALVVGAALFFSYRQTPVYQSQSRVLVRPLGPPTASDLFFAGDVNLVTERGLISSEAVASLVKKDLELPQPASGLLGSLSVTVEPSSEILTIGYASADPKEAQRLAQGFADAYLQFRRQQAQSQYETQAEAIRQRIDEVNVALADVRRRLQHAGHRNATALTQQTATLATRLGILQVQLDDLGSAEALQHGGGEVVQPAVLPTLPSSPNHLKDGMLALLAGLALGIGTAFAQEHLDDRLRGSQDFEEQLGAPILATIPKVDVWKRKDRTKLITVEAPRSSPAEAYRALRTNIQFISRATDFRVVAITSPHLGDGKTTTVANLAVTMAQAGRRVVALSCDLRKPRLHRFFNLENKIGVTSVLSGEVTLAKATQRPDIDNLRVLASGPVPQNPAELLGSDEMETLLARLRGYSDFVLIDTPPLLAVADALILGPKSDGVVIVVDAAKTDRVAAASAADQLSQVGGNIVGGVFNNYDPSQARYYRADYRHYYPYQYYQQDGEQLPIEADNGQEPAFDPDDIWTG